MCHKGGTMKIAIMNTKNTILKQIEKIESELKEVNDEATVYERYGLNEEQVQFEALDLLTATFNLVNMLNIPPEVAEAHKRKMIEYQYDPNRMYEILRFVEVEL